MSTRAANIPSDGALSPAAVDSGPPARAAPSRHAGQRPLGASSGKNPWHRGHVSVAFIAVPPVGWFTPREAARVIRYSEILTLDQILTAQASSRQRREEIADLLVDLVRLGQRASDLFAQQLA